LKNHSCPAKKQIKDLVQDPTILHRKLIEKLYQRAGRAGLHPINQAVCGPHRADLKTDSHIIQVCYSSQWPNKIGELMRNALYHPFLDPVLVLYGTKIEEKDLEDCALICARYGIVLSASWLDPELTPPEPALEPTPEPEEDDSDEESNEENGQENGQEK